MAVNKSQDVKAMVEAGNGLRQLKFGRRISWSSPRNQYLQTLDDVVNTYQKLEMPKGVKAAQDLIKNSHEFFDMVNSAEKATPEIRQQWRVKSNELRKMVQDLPES